MREKHLEFREETEDRYLMDVARAKSDIMIDYCHETGLPYMRYVKQRGFVRVWPLIHVVNLDTVLTEGRY